jgi:hypothetical protein
MRAPGGTWGFDVSAQVLRREGGAAETPLAYKIRDDFNSAIIWQPLHACLALFSMSSSPRFYSNFDARLTFLIKIKPKQIETHLEAKR